jgi:hypothetical protein
MESCEKLKEQKDKILLKQQEELKEAQDLIKKIYKYSGSNADTDFKLWKETEKYCKEKKLV